MSAEAGAVALSAAASWDRVGRVCASVRARVIACVCVRAHPHALITRARTHSHTHAHTCGTTGSVGRARLDSSALSFPILLPALVAELTATRTSRDIMVRSCTMAIPSVEGSMLKFGRGGAGEIDKR